MIDVFEYENHAVFVRCLNGREYKGLVKWCARADDIDETSDMINIDGIGVLANEIESISIIEKTA